MPLAGRINFQFNLVCENRAENVKHCFLKASNRCSVISECSLRCSSGCSLVSLAFWHKLEGSEMHLVTASIPVKRLVERTSRMSTGSSAKALLVMNVFNLECFSPCLAVVSRTRHQQFRLFWNERAASAEGPPCLCHSSFDEFTCVMWRVTFLFEINLRKCFPTPQALHQASVLVVQFPPHHRTTGTFGSRAKEEPGLGPATTPELCHGLTITPWVDLIAIHPQTTVLHWGPLYLCATRGYMVIPSGQHQTDSQDWTSTTLVWLRQWQLTCGELYKVSHLTLLRHFNGLPGRKAIKSLSTEITLIEVLAPRIMMYPCHRSMSSKQSPFCNIPGWNSWHAKSKQEHFF